MNLWKTKSWCCGPTMVLEFEKFWAIDNQDCGANPRPEFMAWITTGRRAIEKWESLPGNHISSFFSFCDTVFVAKERFLQLFFEKQVLKNISREDAISLLSEEEMDILTQPEGGF